MTSAPAEYPSGWASRSARACPKGFDKNPELIYAHSQLALTLTSTFAWSLRKTDGK